MPPAASGVSYPLLEHSWVNGFGIPLTSCSSFTTFYTLTNPPLFVTTNQLLTQLCPVKAP